MLNSLTCPCLRCTFRWLEVDSFRYVKITFHVRHAREFPSEKPDVLTEVCILSSIDILILWEGSRN